MPPALRRSSPFLFFATIAVLCLVAVPAASTGAGVATIDPHSRPSHDFERFLRRYEAANTDFVNGDPARWLRITADKNPVSIFGGLGETGLATVHQRYLLAANAFQPSGAKVDFEYLVKDVQGRLAYTVAIERANVLYTGTLKVGRRYCA